MEKKANHQVNIVRLGEPRVHANADSLELFDIGAFQVVTKKGEFHTGDLGVYIQPDSVVPQTEPFRFIWEAHQGLDGVVPEKRRRITVRSGQIEGINQSFTADQLRFYVNNNVQGGVSPSTADRVLRDLRLKGQLDYVVLNRPKSLYRAVPLPTATPTT